MARCGCSGSGICACALESLVEGDCITTTITGNGSSDFPYTVISNINFDFDTDECLNCGVDGVQLVFDPETDDCLNCGPSGIRIVVSPTAGNQLTCSGNGLLVPAAAPPVSGTAAIVTADTNCIDFSGDGTAGTPLSAVPIISLTAGNQLTCTANGLYAAPPVSGTTGIVTTDSGSIDFSGDGTAGSPLTAVTIAGGHTHDGSGGGTSLVVGGVNEAGGTVPTSTSLQSIAIGDFANAGTGTQPIAIGSGTNATSAPSATGQGAIAIGSSNASGIAGARAAGTSSVAIGSGDATTTGASASSADSIAIGRNAVASNTFSVFIGAFTNPQSPGNTHSIAIGAGVNATAAARSWGSGSCIAIGSNTDSGTSGPNSSGGSAIAIGGGSVGFAGAQSAGTAAIAIGRASNAGSTNGIAIGGSSTAGAVSNAIALGAFTVATTANNVIAIGSGTDATRAASATATGSIAIGASDAAAVSGARATGLCSVAIGGGTTGAAGAAASAQSAIAIGLNAIASGTLAIAEGQSSLAQGTNSIAIGAVATVVTGADYGTAIGSNAQITTTSGDNGIAIGGGSDTTRGPIASNASAIAIGSSNAAVNGARASGTQSIAIGGGTTAQAGASASGAQAIAIGRTAAASHANAVALGDGVATTNTAQVNIGTKRAFIGVPTTAPADADVINSQTSMWLDESTHDFFPAYKAKTSGGTVKTGGLNLGAWLDYTPTLTQSATVTKTITYARWTRSGRTIHAQGFLVVTGTGTAANAVVVGLPVAAAANQNTIIGSAFIFDSSAALGYGGLTLRHTSTITAAFRGTSSPSNNLLGAELFTDALAVGDEVFFYVTYEATT